MALPFLKLLRELLRRGTPASVPSPYPASPPPPAHAIAAVHVREDASDATRQKPQPVNHVLNVGDVVGDRFRLTRTIASGGFATVFEATDMTNDRIVALKASLSRDTEHERCLWHEIGALSRIRHSNVVELLAASDPCERQPYLVMELLQGEELRTRLRRVGALSMREVLCIGKGICAGLAAAHGARVIHADLCPRGVFLTATARGECAKLLDFGLAWVDGSDPFDSTLGLIWGKLNYFSPEQVGGKKLDVRSDLYQVGLILFEMITGRAFCRLNFVREVRQFHQNTNPRYRLQRVSNVPQALVELLVRTLAYEPSGRPQSATELGEALAAIELELSP